MMNPPFYSSDAEMASSAAAKSRPPNSACTGSATEMIYADGGEVGFVSRLVIESLNAEVGGRVQWFTSMLGKLGSVGEIVGILRKKGCRNWAVGALEQGQTR